MIMYSIVNSPGRCGYAKIITIVHPLWRWCQKAILMILKLHLLRRREWMILNCLIAPWPRTITIRQRRCRWMTIISITHSVGDPYYVRDNHVDCQIYKLKRQRLKMVSLTMRQRWASAMVSNGFSPPLAATIFNIGIGGKFQSLSLLLKWRCGFSIPHSLWVGVDSIFDLTFFDRNRSQSTRWSAGALFGVRGPVAERIPTYVIC